MILINRRNMNPGGIVGGWSKRTATAAAVLLLLPSAVGSLPFQRPSVFCESMSTTTSSTNWQKNTHQHCHHGPAALFADSNAHSSNDQLRDDDDDDDDDDEPRMKAYGNRSLSWTKRYRQLLPYEYARNRVMSWGLRTREDYQAEIKGPYLPRHPDQMYASEWVSWDEFLGVMRSYDEARYIVRSVLQLKTMDEYQAFVQADRKRAEGLRIPAKPDIVYKNKGWISGDHFLGWKKSKINDDEDDNNMDVESRFA